MILRSIRLHPFAGLHDRGVEFHDGLNVVLGENEAGKSTLLRALRNALFTSVSLTQSKFKKEMASFLPATGGDTIRVSMSFDVAGENCQIQKTWGGTQNCRLKLATGGEFTDAAVVDGRLKGLLALNEGTFDRILITQQAELAGTLRGLLADGDVLNSFSDLLRRMIVETEGMSAGHMLETVRLREQECFERWDEATEGPEGSRGIDHPWLKGVGRILKTHYDLKACEHNLKRATEYELKIDDLVRQSNLLEQRIRELQAYCDRNAPIVNDVQKRIVLELRKDSLSKDICEMKEAATSWPRDEAKVEFLSGAITRARAHLMSLREEGAVAEQFEKQRTLRTTYEEARTRSLQLSSEERKLSSTTEVSDSDTREIRALLDELKRIDVQIKAQQLNLNLKATAPVHVELSTILGEKKSISLNAGESLKESIGGQCVLSHRDWELTVSAGSGEVNSLVDRRKALEEKVTRAFERFGVSSLEALLAGNMAYRQQREVVGKQRAAFEAVTRGKSFAEIEAAVKALPDVKPGRSMQEIRNDIERVTEEGTQLKSDLQMATKSIETFTQEYGSQQSLQDTLLKNLGEEKEIESQIARLEPLPEGYRDSRKFLDEFESMKNELSERVNALHSIQIERKECEKDAPEDTQIELRNLVSDARVAHERALQTGKAYRRIRRELESILARADERAFLPFQGQIEKTLRSLTGGRYTKIVADKALPKQIAGDSASLPVGLLSSGTLDVLALAVRLSMAEYYLEGTGGFVVMDDPLVNLDPARQGAAAKCIREFSERYQVILLTCHPSHGEVLGGNRVLL